MYFEIKRRNISLAGTDLYVCVNKYVEIAEKGEKKHIGCCCYFAAEHLSLEISLQLHVSF